MKYLIICFWLTSLFHGGHVAEYYYELEGKQLNLKFIIETEVVAGFEFEGDCNFENMTALCMVQYINQHSSIKINGEKLEMELQNSYTEQDHLIIHLKSELNADSINKINIHNRCFYEFDRDFKNRIILDVGLFQKSYLLNRKRNKIKLRK